MRPQVPEWAKVKYYHERTVDEPDGPISPKGGITYAALFNQEGLLVALGVAVCHHRDNFNRRIGRDIALGRALHNFENGLFPSDLESLAPARRTLAGVLSNPAIRRKFSTVPQRIYRET